MSALSVSGLTGWLCAELHRYLLLLPLLKGKLPGHLMGSSHHPYLIHSHGLQVVEVVFVPSRLHYIILSIIQEDHVAVVTVARHPGEFSRNLCDVLHTKVIGCHHHIFPHQQCAAQRIREPPLCHALDGDAVSTGGQVQLLDQRLGAATEGHAHAHFLIHQHIVATDGRPPRQNHWRLPAYNDTLGQLFDQGNAAGVRHDVFSDLINVHVQRACAVAAGSQKVHAQPNAHAQAAHPTAAAGARPGTRAQGIQPV